ncbi:MAG: hypothetical protein WCE54_24210 [Ignavibacteriaceae bacterium]
MARTMDSRDVVKYASWQPRHSPDVKNHFMTLHMEWLTILKYYLVESVIVWPNCLKVIQS